MSDDGESSNNTGKCKKPSKIKIDQLPVEVLEMIFQDLDLKDLLSCTETCAKWGTVIEKMIQNLEINYHIARRRFDISKVALEILRFDGGWEHLSPGRIFVNGNILNTKLMTASGGDWDGYISFISTKCASTLRNKFDAMKLHYDKEFGEFEDYISLEDILSHMTVKLALSLIHI